MKKAVCAALLFILMLGVLTACAAGGSPRSWRRLGGGAPEVLLSCGAALQDGELCAWELGGGVLSVFGPGGTKRLSAVNLGFMLIVSDGLWPDLFIPVLKN